jgi:Asp/Glu/hydantoin racemase
MERRNAKEERQVTEAEKTGKDESATIGILMLDTQFPRVPGDIGNPATFPFPVRYHRVPEASAENVVRKGAKDLLPAFIEGARMLQGDGVQAITTSCGFLARFQRDLASAVTVPVFTSSLLLVPLVHRMLGPDRRVGILTFDAPALTERELASAGIPSDLRLAIMGMESHEEFYRVILEDRPALDVEAARREHIQAATRLCETHPDVGAIVLECTNMPPYRAAIQRATGLPVFDIVQLLTLVHQALSDPVAAVDPAARPIHPRRTRP